ncbi:MAG TPA: AAA family ATPase [Oscillatoriaceae cyanobacterium M33_DOE_052]|uniref:histidine kinase n=1 Tax=Planktothricoides sp. SpSt-374 TaxID=2282167 RepID=A0A7C3ZNU8_9CYAN|nr:AAA family ATPase [Oscillatoriaceae cyanobacterium M33_DOE_052]
MIAISGYTISSKIYESSSSLVYRAARNSDGLKVILKVLRHNTTDKIAKFKQEYEINRSLQHLEGVIKVWGWEQLGKNLSCMTLEDFGGESLKNVMAKRSFPLAEILSIAINVSETLGEIHAASIIHKDINPANILLHPETGEVKIIDFGIALLLSRENPTIKSPTFLEGTLPYISPEQTGRMNRAVDYRTDFYSLGVTFYEMLTGRVPFDTQDPMELVHAHIAKQPIPPHEVNPEVPEPLSQLVMKLLAKTAEDRYQSAWGIKADLVLCLMQLEANGIIEELIPGDNDVSDKFQIPQKLYGREAEVAALLAALERASAGSQEMMLISGYSGIGKSSLVQEIYHRKVKGARREQAKLGYLITGKFDQYQRQVPYSGLVLAFADLVRQLLMESDAHLQQWREKILTACGAHGQILIDVIPELALIIGEVPPLPNVGATEAQSQFKKVLQKFIGVFCSPDRPLVIFLDDIQWADTATFNWLESVLTEELHHLLWIFAYQIRETANPGHPWVKLLEVLRQKGMTFETIALAPLQVPDITEMIAETLNESPDKVKPLAELVMRKTGGNPFFVSEFLKTLYQENLLQFNFQYLSWQWDSERIPAMDITDNVIDLTVALLQKLPDATQEVLRLAACIGESFDLTTLCYLQEKSPSDTLADLSPAIDEGLILPDHAAFMTTAPGAKYKFLHQKVQEAAGALIDEQWQKSVHFKIGRHLLRTTPPAEKHERLFEIVSHLNAGKDWLVGSREKVELARLNLEAGKKAKDATAYAAALEYFRTGAEILGGDDWEVHYDLTFTLHKELAEAEYLNGDLAGATKSIELTLSKALGPLDKAETCNLMMAITRMAGAYSASLTAGQQGLRLLGVTVPESDWDKALGQEIAAVNSYLEAISNGTVSRAGAIASLFDAPEMSQPDHRCAAKLVMNLMETARWFHRELFAWSSAKLVSLSLQHGNAPESALGYANYGVFLGTASGAYRDGRLFGKLAMRLSDKFNNIAYKCKVCLVVANYIIPWTSHLKHATSINNEGYQAGLESGNLPDAGYILLLKLMEMFFQGKTLTLINPYLNSCIKFLHKTGNEVAETIATSLHWAIEELKVVQVDSFSSTAAATTGGRPYVEGNGCLSRDNAGENLFAFCQQQIIKTQILYLKRSYEEARRASEEAAELLAYISGDIATASHNFYTSLTLVALYPAATPGQKTDYWQRLEANQAQMAKWAESATENFQHKYLLVAAEMARLSGQDLEAITLYDRAIESATENEFVHIAAIASELAAEFWLTRTSSDSGAYSLLKYAKLHIMEARDGYARWGAHSKVEALEKLYPQLLPTNSSESDTIHRSGSRMTTEGNTTQQLSKNSRYLDLSAVLKASRAISSEIVMDKLLDNLMKILIENAGARKGFLLLVRDGNLTISASCSVDALENKTGFCNDPAKFNQTVPRNPVAGKEADFPLTAINYVERTRTDLVLSDAAREGQFTADPYIAENNIKSLLCTPIINGGQLIGILYLENNLTTGAFTPDRLEMLRVLSSQAAISLENALLYASLEQKVAERTRELNEKNERLQKTLLDLQRAQAQLIQTEKMSSLGQMVAGVAHEINNPVNFIYGNVAHARDYVEDLLALLNLYRQEYPAPTPGIQQALEETDLDFISEDLEKLLFSMKRGAERIRNIIISLRNFSRLDEADMKSVDLHEGIDSTILILQHKFKAENSRNGGTGNPAIMVVKQYGQLPKVTCYASAINQVFMSIITNAIDALRSNESSGMMARDDLEPQITIRTELATLAPLPGVTQSPELVRIRIADNGPGMTEDVLQKIFDPFFTTKPVGSGVGLGLSVSYSIVVDRHGGKLACTSTPGVGTEFAIELPLKLA